jgi:ABC-type glycerol-3-phosphate transport system permease component
MSNHGATRESRVSRTAAMALMFILAIYFLLPIYFLLVAATKPQGDLASTFGLAFSHFNLFQNLGNLFGQSNGIFAVWALNSVIYAVLGAAVGTLISALCGYALAKFRFRGREFLFSVILGGVLVPTTALALPLFLLFSAASYTVRFRDWLRTDPAGRRAYQAAKEQAALARADDPDYDNYTRDKAAFFDRVQHDYEQPSRNDG